MDTAEIIDALAENNLDLARSKINTALNEKAVEAISVAAIIARNFVRMEISQEVRDEGLMADTIL